MKPVAFLGLALLALGLVAAAPRASSADDTPWLGVTLQSLNDGLRDGMGYDGEGVLVNRVMDGSPADHAGLRKGDVIVSLSGRSAESPEELTRMVRDARVGQTVALTIVRDGDRRTLSVRLGNRPDDADMPDEGTRVRVRDDQGNMDHGDMDHGDMDRGDMDHGDMDHGDMDHGDMDDHGHMDMDDTKDMKDLKDLKELKGPQDTKVLEGMPRMESDGRTFFLNGMGRGRLGVRAEDLSSDLAPYFDAPSGGGALVMEVLKDTPAERAGLKAGDVVIRVEDEKISDAEDLVRTLHDAPAGRIHLTVMRHGTRRTFEAELAEAPRGFGQGRGSMSYGPGNRRVIVRDKNGTRVYGDQSPGNRDEEMQQLRDEVRRLRQELNDQRRDKSQDDDDNN